MGLLSNLSKIGGSYNKNKLSKDGVYLVAIESGGVIKDTRKRNSEGEPCKRLTPDLKVLEVLAGDDDSHKEGELTALPLFEHPEYPQYFIRDVAGLTQAVGGGTGDYEEEVAAEMDAEELDEYMDTACETLFTGAGAAAKDVPFIVQVSSKQVDGKSRVSYLFKPA